MVSSVNKNPIDTVARHQGAKFTPIKSFYTDTLQVERKRLAPKLGIIPLMKARNTKVQERF